MPTISIYRGNQRCEAHAALGGDLSQTVPVLVFKTDAGLVVCNINRTLRRAVRNLNVRTSLPEMSHRGMLLGGCLAGRPLVGLGRRGQGARQPVFLTLCPALPCSSPSRSRPPLVRAPSRSPVDECASAWVLVSARSLALNREKCSGARFK